MKKKNKVLLTSMATIAMCASLVAGGTYALFTSESAVNIAVTSATVNVQATIGELTLSSTVDGVTTAGVDGKWVNGGTATVDGDTITLDKMTPGDTVSFEITVTNYSDVAVKARTVYHAEGELFGDGGLVVDGFGEVQNTGVTLWTTLAAASETGSVVETHTVSITLPEDAGNKYQNKTASIQFGVEAVQGNADVDDPFTVSYDDTEETFVSFVAALDCYKNANASDVEIAIAEGTYYNTNVVVEQFENKNLTIKADGKVTFANNTAATPVLLIDGNGGWNNTETLTFDGLTFDLNNGAYGITFPSGNDVRYAHNVTVQNCTFVGTDNTGFGVQCNAAASPNAVTVSTCKAEGIDTFVSMYVKTLSVSGCTATNINGFVNNQSAEGTTSLTNCTATVNGKEAGYFARVNGGTLNVTDSTVALESKCAYTTGAIVVRGATNVTLANNTITATVADGVNGAAATVCQAAAGQATVTSDKAYTLYTGYKTEPVSVSDTNDLNNALSNGTPVNLSGNVTLSDNINNDASIKLNDNTLSLTGSDLPCSGSLTVTDGTVDVSKGYFDLRSTKDSEVVFENVDFVNTTKEKTWGNSTNHVRSAIEVFPQSNEVATIITFKECTFINSQVIIEATSDKIGTVNVVFENCKFENFGNAAAINVQNYLTCNITIKNCEFDITATSNVSIVDAMSSSTVNVTFEETNKINGIAATPTTDASLAGTVDEVKVFSSQSVKPVSSLVDSVEGLDTITVSGIAKK